MIRAKPEVEGLTPYVAPLEGRRLKLRLDFNENTAGPSPKVLEAIRALGPADYASYPEYDGLCQDYARAHGLSIDRVLAFNGVDAAIRALFDAFGEAGCDFLTTSPTFGYYAPCAAQQGMRVVAMPYTDSLVFPQEAFAAALADRPRMCFICNPNNPTGTLIPAADVIALARGAPDTLVVVDELYFDFTGVSVIPGGASLPNLVTLRSLSKSYGLAALRIGFALGAPAILDRLARVVGPYDINTFAVVAARAALSDPGHKDAYIAEVTAARAWTLLELRRRGLRVHADGGNFALVWPGVPLAPLVAGLDAAGILVRSMANKPLIDGSFRLTIGTRTQMAQFINALDSVRPKLSGA